MRARMVSDPADYRWSSYRSNAQSLPSVLLRPHAAYAGLGMDMPARCAAYHALFADALDTEEIARLRSHTQQGAAWGSARFAQEIELALGRRVVYRPPGRPRKDEASSR